MLFNIRVVAMIIALSLAALTIPGCIEPSSDSSQRQATEKMVSLADKSVGLPNITNFTEKRNMRFIYELKDQEIATYSYFMDMNGKLHFLCNSIGYGVPASVQYVNPYKYLSGKGTVITQAEPNSLFMPDGLDATYVLCSDGESSTPRPVYSEPRLIVSPFPLNSTTSLLK